MVESLEAIAEDPSRFVVPNLSDAEAFYEIPPGEDAKEMIALAGKAGVSAKIRTGGVLPENIPSTADVVRFVKSCASSRVQFKATAGLHHPFPGTYPLTYEPESEQGQMHGFMNLALTASLIWQGLADFKTACALMEEEAPPFSDRETGLVHWGDWTFPPPDLRESRRRFFRSFGSCSFVEPLDGLKEAGLLGDDV